MPRFIMLLAVVAGIAAAAAAPASASSLEFEYLQGTEVTLQDLQCNPEGTSTATFLVSGTAGGPHPGTFDSTITLTAGDQTFGDGPLLAVNETFAIVSGDTLITGTKRLVPRQERFYPFSCRVTPSGDCEDVFVRASTGAEALRYDATINGPEGTQQEGGYTDFQFGFDGLRCGGEMQFSSGAMDEFFTLVISPNDPTTVVLTPQTAVNVVNTYHEVTATVADESGEPASGAIVRFNVTGASSASGDCMTFGGECTFSYQVGPFPGEDTISAYADVNANGVQEAGEPTATAMNTIVLPPSTPGRTTGEGKYVDNQFGEVTFTLNARSDGSTLRGSCKFTEKASGTTIKCLDVLAYVQYGNSATFYGHAEREGVSTLYAISVVDYGPHGPADYVVVSTAAGYAAGGALTNGDIQVR